MVYHIICGYINFNDSHGYGRLKYLTSCYRVYAMHYSSKLEVTYQKYCHKNYITQFGKYNFYMVWIEEIQICIEVHVKNENHMWDKLIVQCLELHLKVEFSKMMASIWWRYNTIPQVPVLDMLKNILEKILINYMQLFFAWVIC